MKINTYLTESEKTLSAGFDVKDQKSKNILHAVIGLSTEAGEMLDTLKRNVFYGTELDEVNLKEEMGDIMWYMAILLRELDLDLEEDVLQTNIDKLRSRYGEKFSQDHAENRDLDTERKILEQVTK